MTIRVLVADDQEIVRTGLRMILDAQPGIEVVGDAADGDDGCAFVRPYSKASGWGAGLAYTLVLRSKGRGFEFNFDNPDISEQPFVPNAGNEKHRAVLNGIVDLPLDFRASGLVVYGSGAPFFVIDALEGFQPDRIRLGHFENVRDFLQVDLRLQKIFRIFGDREVSLSAEVFNLFNRANFGGAEGFICCGGNPNFGRPTSLAGPPRSFQFGVATRF